MLEIITGKLKTTDVYNELRAFRNKIKADKEVKAWINDGKPMPVPHRVKQDTLRFLMEAYGLKNLVETGTFLGDMVHAMKELFHEIYTIEINPTLAENAKKRFRKYPHIQVINGDSGAILDQIMPKISAPTLFWLDGHYSGGITGKGKKETPIIEEISHIVKGPELSHVLVVDDARCFGKEADYPSLEEFKNYLHSRCTDLIINVINDSIICIPKGMVKKTSL